MEVDQGLHGRAEDLSLGIFGDLGEGDPKEGN